MFAVLPTYGSEKLKTPKKSKSLRYYSRVGSITTREKQYDEKN
jgi:hypothetical protein